jgi:hypothetical protein
MLYFLFKLCNLQAAYILPLRLVKMTRFAIEIHQNSMVAGALPRTPLGAHSQVLLGPRWVVLLKRWEPLLYMSYMWVKIMPHMRHSTKNNKCGLPFVVCSQKR